MGSEGGGAGGSQSHFSPLPLSLKVSDNIFLKLSEAGTIAIIPILQMRRMRQSSGLT